MKRLISKALAAALLLSLSMVMPAKADAFGIKLSQAYGLTENQIITVTVNGLPSDKGIYVLQCVLSAGQLTRDPKDCTSQQNLGSALWFSSQTGASNPALPASFKILQTINDKSCVANGCAIISMRDHVDRTDQSFNTFTPIQVSSIAFSLNKSSGLIDNGDSVQVSIAGLSADKGVYARQCEIPTAGTRPLNCDNARAVWATNVVAYQSMGGVPANLPFALNVSGWFKGKNGGVDCQLVKCGIYLESDWTALSNRSLDTLLPISFAGMKKVRQTVASWKTAPGSKSIKLGSTVNLIESGLTTTQGSTLTWKSSNGAGCAVSTSGANVTVIGQTRGTCTITATAAASARGLLTTFTWRLTVTK
ncbi:MAG: hypothetical protein KGQ38_05935 [Actinomycetales bacterium]|nr:hypothetical protein [Actinomycetales bacterium]